MRPRAAIPAATISSTTIISAATAISVATMEATAAAMRPASTTAAMRPATAATTAVTATAAALSPCWIWHESQTDESHKCDEGSTKTESGHNPYLPNWERGFERGTYVRGRSAPA
jgi:hypothetical protein